MRRRSCAPASNWWRRRCACEEKIAACDLVITGEGRLDAQTLDGKGPAGIAALARRAGKPVLALAGSFALELERQPLFDATCPIIDAPTTLPEAMAAGRDYLERAAYRAARLVRLGATALAPALCPA